MIADRKDSYLHHEALHTASLAMDFINRHVMNHRYINGQTRYAELADVAYEALFELYQLLGAEQPAEDTAP